MLPVQKAIVAIRANKQELYGYVKIGLLCMDLEPIRALLTTEYQCFA